MSTDVGAFYRTSLTCFDSTGALATPSTKSVAVTLPDQTTGQAPSVVVDSVGKLHADYQGTVEGLHKFVWTTGSPTSSKVDYENFVLYRSIVGLGEMRAYLHSSSTVGDEILRSFLSMATELAERIAGTCVPKVITNEVIDGDRRMAIRLPQAPIMPNTAVTIRSDWPGGPVWTDTGNGATLSVSLESGVVNPFDYIGFWMGPWNATYTAGRLVIPQRIVMAVKLIVSDLWASQRGQLNDPLMPSMQNELEFEARMPPGYEIPAQAKQWLKRGSNPGFA